MLICTLWKMYQLKLTTLMPIKMKYGNTTVFQNCSVSKATPLLCAVTFDNIYFHSLCYQSATLSQSSQPLSVSSYPTWCKLVQELEIGRDHLQKHSIANALDNVSRENNKERFTSDHVVITFACFWVSPSSTDAAGKRPFACGGGTNGEQLSSYSTGKSDRWSQHDLEFPS